MGREDLEHDFDLAEFNASCRVMKCARQLFPHSEASRKLGYFCLQSVDQWTTGLPRQGMLVPRWKRISKSSKREDKN